MRAPTDVLRELRQVERVLGLAERLERPARELRALRERIAALRAEVASLRPGPRVVPVLSEQDPALAALDGARVEIA